MGKKGVIKTDRVSTSKRKLAVMNRVSENNNQFWRQKQNAKSSLANRIAVFYLTLIIIFDGLQFYSIHKRVKVIIGSREPENII